MNNKLLNLYLDIGNTNIKYCFDDEKIIIAKSNIFELSKIFNNYLVTHNIYLINVNYELNEFIKQNTSKNLFVFDKKEYYKEFNIPSKFNYKEIGHDIYFMINYLNELNSKNSLLISYGTYNVYIIKKNNIIESIQIELGNSIINNFLANKFNLDTTQLIPNLMDVRNTLDSINSSSYFRIIGTIEFIKKYYELNDSEIIFCGNNIDKIINNNFCDSQIFHNLVLISFKKWCVNKFMKK